MKTAKKNPDTGNFELTFEIPPEDQMQSVSKNFQNYFAQKNEELERDGECMITEQISKIAWKIIGISQSDVEDFYNEAVALSKEF